MFMRCIEIIVLFGCLKLSGQFKTCPIEVNTINYFHVNASYCGESELKVLCDNTAYCYKDVGFGGDRCNKTNDGVLVNIPIERKNCDTLGMKCDNNNTLLDCELLKYKRPDNVSCTYDVNDVNVLITCKAVGIYPRGKCQIQLYFNKTEKSVNSLNETQKSNGMLFDASCNFSYPITHYDEKNNVIDISVYPNVTNIQYGRNVTLTISLDLSVSISHCPREYTHVNETINCTCVRSDDSQITAQPMWYNRRHEVQFNGSPTLSIKAFNIHQVYYCVAKNHNMSSNNVTYSATLIKGNEAEHDIDLYSIIVAVAVFVLICIFFVLLDAKYKKFTNHKSRLLQASQSNSRKSQVYEVHINNDDIYNINYNML